MEGWCSTTIANCMYVYNLHMYCTYTRRYTDGLSVKQGGLAMCTVQVYRVQSTLLPVIIYSRIVQTAEQKIIRGTME